MMGRAWTGVMSGVYSNLLQPTTVAKKSSEHMHTRMDLKTGSLATPSVHHSLNGGRVAILCDVGLDLIADCHLVHLGVIVNAHTPGLAGVVLDRDIFRPNVVHTSGNRFLGNAFTHGRGSRATFRRILGASH